MENQAVQRPFADLPIARERPISGIASELASFIRWTPQTDDMTEGLIRIISSEHGDSVLGASYPMNTEDPQLKRAAQAALCCQAYKQLASNSPASVAQKEVESTITALIPTVQIEEHAPRIEQMSWGSVAHYACTARCGETVHGFHYNSEHASDERNDIIRSATHEVAQKEARRLAAVAAATIPAPTDETPA